MKYITINMLSGQTVIDKIVPTDALDTYPTHAAIYGLGGHRTVANVAARNAIPSQRREEGMTVYVTDIATKYILQGGITNSNWVIDSSGGSGSAPLPTPTNVPVFQTFTKGAGYTSTYNLTDVSNGSLAVAFDVSNIQTTRPVEIVFANGKPVYDNLFPRTKSHRITGTVDGAGLVTLSAAPYSGYSADIQIHFYYRLTSSNAISNYYYNDVLVTPEVDIDLNASDVLITDTGNNFTATDVEAALVELNVLSKTQEVLVVQKNPGTGQYSTIESALAAITDNSITKPYLIKVGPGVYTETNPLVMKPYVYIEGSGEQETVIQPVTTTTQIITGVANSKISNLQLNGATGVGGKAINCSNTASVNPFLVETVLFGSNETLINVSSTVAITLVKVSNCTAGGLFNFTDGGIVTSSNVAQPAILIYDGFSFLDVVPTFPTRLFKASGVGAQLAIADILARTGSGGTAIYAEDGAEVRVIASTFRGFQYGIHSANVGAGPLIRSTGVNFESSTYDVFVENASTTGYLTGYIDYLKQSIVAGSSFFISDKPTQTIKVAKKGGDFTSIAAAVDSITDAAANKPYLILVGAGEFTEPQINLQSYVSIAGITIQSSIVIPDGNHHVFNMAQNTEISFLTIKGIGSVGKAAIYSNDTGDYTQAHKISIYDCDIGILTEALTQDTITYCEYVDINGVFTNAVKAYSPNAFTSSIVIENFYTFPDAANTGDQILIDGDQSLVTISGSSLLAGGLEKGVVLLNNGNLETKATILDGFTNSIEVDALSASNVIVSGSLFENSSVLDLNILSPTATGYLVGAVDHEKVFINPTSTFYIFGKDLQIITVAKRGGDHLTIANAVNSITDSSLTKPYIVRVGPGVYSEALIDLTTKPYITIEGTSITTTIIEPDAATHHIFNIGVFNDISNLTIKNAGAGFAAINMEDVGIAGEYSRCHRIEIIDCDIGIRLYNANALKDVMFYSEFVTVSGTYSYGTQIENAGGLCACMMSVHYNALPAAGTSPIHYEVKGVGSELVIHACIMEGTGTDTGFLFQDGAEADISATIIKNTDTAINLPNIGTSPTLNCGSTTIINSTTNDLNVAHPTAFVTLSGTTTNTKIVNASSNFSFFYLDQTTGEIQLSNKINMTFPDGTNTDISTLISMASTLGVIQGGVLSDGGTFDVNVTTGFGYYEDVSHILHRKDWTATSITLTADVNKYIFFNSSGVLAADTALPSNTSNIILGRVKTNGTGIEFIEQSSINSEHTSNRYADLLRNGLGPVYKNGSTVTENATPLHLDATGGTFYFGTTKYNPSGATNVSFREYFRDGVGGWTVSDQTAVKVKYDNNSGTLANPTASYYVKHSLFVVGDNSTEKYFLVIGQAEYATILAAQQADIASVPDYFTDAVTLIANVIVQQGSANIIEIQDARPRIGFKALGTSASSDHQSLTNRADPSAHSQYLLRDGTNAMTANLNFGGFTFTNKSGSRTIKTGLTTGASFAGNPKKVTINFGAAFPDTNYTINITGADARNWTYESKAAGSFVINANANTAFTGEVSWSCISTGESVV